MKIEIKNVPPKNLKVIDELLIASEVQSDSEKASILRALLAEVFPTIEESKLVVELAEMNPGYIAFDSKAVLNWFAILSEAKKAGKVNKIVTAAIDLIEASNKAPEKR